MNTDTRRRLSSLPYARLRSLAASVKVLPRSQKKARLIDALTTYYDSRGQMFTEGNDSIVDNELQLPTVVALSPPAVGDTLTTTNRAHNNSHMSLDDSHRSTVNSIISNDMSYTGGTTVQAQHVDQPLSSEDDVPTTPTVVQRQQVLERFRIAGLKQSPVMTERTALLKTSSQKRLLTGGKNENAPATTQSTPGKRHIPNFRAIHERQLNKMDDLKDYHAKKMKRAEVLITGDKVPRCALSAKKTPSTKLVQPTNTTTRPLMSTSRGYHFPTPTRTLNGADFAFAVDTQLKQPPKSIPVGATHTFASLVQPATKGNNELVKRVQRHVLTAKKQLKQCNARNTPVKTRRTPLSSVNGAVANACAPKAPTKLIVEQKTPTENARKIMRPQQTGSTKSLTYRPHTGPVRYVDTTTMTDAEFERHRSMNPLSCTNARTVVNKQTGHLVVQKTFVHRVQSASHMMIADAWSLHEQVLDRL